MSVEASIALPVFLFVMYFFINLCEIYAVKADVYEACIETAEYMSEYAYLMDRLGDGKSNYSLTCLPVAGLRFQNYVDDNALLEQDVVCDILHAILSQYLAHHGCSNKAALYLKAVLLEPQFKAFNDLFLAGV